MNKIDITTIFNNMGVRILGTLETPFFYATDVAKALGLKNVHANIAKFDEDEIVSPEVRKQYGLITHRKIGGRWCRDDKIVLLTEPGMYRLIICSNSVYAIPLRKHLYNILCEKRRAELVKLNIISTENHEAMVKEYEVKLSNLTNELNDYKHHVPAMYVLKRPINGPLKNFMIPKDVDEDMADNEYDGELYMFTPNINPRELTIFTLVGRILDIDDKIIDALSDTYHDSDDSDDDGDINSGSYVPVSMAVCQKKFYHFFKGPDKFNDFISRKEEEYPSIKFIEKD